MTLSIGIWELSQRLKNEKMLNDNCMQKKFNEKKTYILLKE